MRSGGWFAIPGVQRGTRTLEEQMRGLAQALSEAEGKTVADLGCAEGCISIEFAKAGASSVYACDFNEPMIETARALAEALPVDVQKPGFYCKDLRTLIAEERDTAESWQYDIVLALAIAHKLDDPLVAIEFVADICRSLAVFRLPIGSDGTVISGKHSGVARNLHEIMKGRGFALERTEKGPRKELVHYWRRQPS